MYADPDGTRRDIGACAFEAAYAPAPQSDCTSKLNSLSCTPAMGWSGSASASPPSPFLAPCSNVLNQRVGLLTYSFAPRATPLQGGISCVATPFARTPSLNSGGS